MLYKKPLTLASVKEVLTRPVKLIKSLRTKENLGTWRKTSRTKDDKQQNISSGKQPDDTGGRQKFAELLPCISPRIIRIINDTLEGGSKDSAAPRFFNSLLSVRKSAESF